MVLVIAVRPHRQAVAAELRPSGIPPSVPTSLANLMGLSPAPATPAPSFTLTDQHGRHLTLTGFRGKAAVLEFMDSHCVTICPLVAEEFICRLPRPGAAGWQGRVRRGQRQPLSCGRARRRPLLRRAPADDHRGLALLHQPIPRLRAVWHAYHIEVQPRGPRSDTIHTSAVCFIDPQGRERYLAAPWPTTPRSAPPTSPGPNRRVGPRHRPGRQIPGFLTRGAVQAGLWPSSCLAAQQYAGARCCCQPELAGYCLHALTAAGSLPPRMPYAGSWR